jgi:hypothetical protein
MTLYMGQIPEIRPDRLVTTSYTVQGLDTYASIAPWYQALIYEWCYPTPIYGVYISSCIGLTIYAKYMKSLAF